MNACFYLHFQFALKKNLRGNGRNVGKVEITNKCLCLAEVKKLVYQ